MSKRTRNQEPKRPTAEPPRSAPAGQRAPGSDPAAARPRPRSAQRSRSWLQRYRGRLLGDRPGRGRPGCRGVPLPRGVQPGLRLHDHPSAGSARHGGARRDAAPGPGDTGPRAHPRAGRVQRDLRVLPAQFGQPLQRRGRRPHPGRVLPPGPGHGPGGLGPQPRARGDGRPLSLPGGLRDGGSGRACGAPGPASAQPGLRIPAHRRRRRDAVRPDAQAICGDRVGTGLVPGFAGRRADQDLLPPVRRQGSGAVVPAGDARLRRQPGPAASLAPAASPAPTTAP